PADDLLQPLRQALIGAAVELLEPEHDRIAEGLHLGRPALRRQHDGGDRRPRPAVLSSIAHYADRGGAPAQVIGELEPADLVAVEDLAEPALEILPERAARIGG